MTDMRIPAPLQNTAKALGLHDWINRKQFPLHAYCETVEQARELVQRHQQPGDDRYPVNDQIVTVIAQALDTEGALLKHTNKAAYELKDDNDWWTVCKAAGWEVVRRYEAAVEKGEWPSP
jgi:hypothetical protein